MTLLFGTIQHWFCLFHSSHLVMFFNLKFRVTIKHHLLNIRHFSDFYETLKYGFHEVFIEYRLSWVNRVLFENISWEESRFLNPRKSKTKLKIVKPAMVSRHHTYMSRNFFVHCGASFITSLLQTGASLKEASWFR